MLEVLDSGITPIMGGYLVGIGEETMLLLMDALLALEVPPKSPAAWTYPRAIWQGAADVHVEQEYQETTSTLGASMLSFLVCARVPALPVGSV